MCKLGTNLISANNAKTFATQEKNPRVNKFNGKSNTLSIGTNTKLITVKTSAAIKSVFKPPSYTKPGITCAVTHKAPKFIK